jgi:hypothetical protein
VPEPRTCGCIGWTLLGILILVVAWAVSFVRWIFAFLGLLRGLGAVTGRPMVVKRGGQARLPHDADYLCGIGNSFHPANTRAILLATARRDPIAARARSMDALATFSGSTCSGPVTAAARICARTSVVADAATTILPLVRQPIGDAITLI